MGRRWPEARRKVDLRRVVRRDLARENSQHDEKQQAAVLRCSLCGCAAGNATLAAPSGPGDAPEWAASSWPWRRQDIAAVGPEVFVALWGCHLACSLVRGSRIAVSTSATSTLRSTATVMSRKSACIRG